jgi:type I restriction enzyme M protein
MLDAQTKSNIDSARDILVGKVPDPKSQVEQITIALIYKFMDDMDRQSEELGGKATFFTGEFKKYRWANLLDKRLGGHERLLLYAEGLEKVNESKNIPQLFRDIFKGVFLPYRDPETLNLFLKEIAGFSYDHSERLGDAFEYLLSVLGTQGDAGQFRTPRHIIDFIVAVVDPKKNETVLDPACGTAGFLISAFKHIVRNNENLTPDERARLMTNFRGYDIAPDMVRLSRANMYLHGFPNPVIHEYDTLTSEERWDERCDVMLANPPFMTPKGGIRPHNRFSIKAKRSEVLFVDYIAEHLNPSGRAGVIVPEGIIFQSQNAYRALRKMLVENYLWAVVSLPAGVFNPYSGVKTSILFLDRNLTRRTDDVVFVKVENDGFDLGAQRRPIEKNDLPDALKILNDHKKAQKSQEGKIALTVSRKYLLESGDVNLSGDRYRKTIAVQSKWPMVKLAEVCVTSGEYGSNSKKVAYDGHVRYVRITDLDDDGNLKSDEVVSPEVMDKTVWLREGDMLIARSGSVGRTYIHRLSEGNYQFAGYLLRYRVDAAKALPLFVYQITKSEMWDAWVIRQSKTGTLTNINAQQYNTFEFPLPPLAIQRQMVAELEGYRKIIEGARQVLANYKPTIKIDPKWPEATIRDLCTQIQYGLSTALNTKWRGYKTFRMNEIIDGVLVDNGQMKCADVPPKEFKKYRLRKGDVLFNRTNSYEHVGRTGVFLLDGEYAFASYLVRLSLDERKADPRFVNAVMNTPEFQKGIKGFASRAIGQANINASNLGSYAIPVPPLATQREIVAELEAERKLVEGNRELIARFEKKMQAKLAEIWGEETIDSIRADPKTGNKHG